MIRNVPVAQTWAELQARPGAQLCDVRTEPEWRTIGVPDLAEIGKQTAFVSWQIAPAMQRNPDFTQQLEAAGLERDQPIYFICRSGARSLAAAEAASAAGYCEVYNVAEGFEGKPGGPPGWAMQGLPVTLER